MILISGNYTGLARFPFHAARVHCQAIGGRRPPAKHRVVEGRPDRHQTVDRIRWRTRFRVLDRLGSLVRPVAFAFHTIQCRLFDIRSLRGAVRLLPGIKVPNDGQPGPSGHRRLHLGGCNVLFSDASVRLVKETVNPPIFAALATCAGGEIVGGDQIDEGRAGHGRGAIGMPVATPERLPHYTIVIIKDHLRFHVRPSALPDRDNPDPDTGRTRAPARPQVGKHPGRLFADCGLAARDQQGRNHLCVHAMPKVVGVIHAVAGLIPVLLEPEELAPDRGYVGECDPGHAQLRQSVPVLREKLLFERDPVWVADHCGDERINSAVGRFSRMPLMVAAILSWKSLAGLPLESFMPKARRTRSGLASTTLSTMVRPHAESIPPTDRLATSTWPRTSRAAPCLLAPDRRAETAYRLPSQKRCTPWKCCRPAQRSSGIQL